MNKAALTFTLLAATALPSPLVAAHNDNYIRHHHHDHARPAKQVIDSFMICARMENGTGPFMRGDFTVSAHGWPKSYSREAIIKAFSELASESYADDMNTGYLNEQMRALEHRLETKTKTDIDWSYGLFPNRHCTMQFRHR